MEDYRNSSKRQLRHALEDILFLVVTAALCGCEEWTEIESFGKGQITWLRQFFSFKNGIPSHDTLGRIFARLDPEQFHTCFTSWINTLYESTEGKIVSIDGKRLRSSYDKADNKAAVHMVSAYASDINLCLGQLATEEKSNEITAIPALIELIVLKGAIVTIDAMGCQKAIADKIIAQGANYVLGVKDNQKHLAKQAEKISSITNPSDVHTSLDNDHGRIEKRTCKVFTDLTFMDDSNDWKGLKSIVQIQSERYIKASEKVEKSTRYYISSLDRSAQEMNQIIRSHWAIENKLHWVLDVVFNEDQHKKRKGYSAENFSLISKIALAIIENDDTKKSKKGKRTQAAFDIEFREKLMNLNQKETKS